MYQIRQAALSFIVSAALAALNKAQRVLHAALDKREQLAQDRVEGAAELADAAATAYARALRAEGKAVAAAELEREVSDSVLDKVREQFK